MSGANRHRPAATRRQCRSVWLAALLLGGCRPAEEPGSVGSDPAALTAVSGPVTFNEHIAPIVHRHCSICHNELGSAPFPLVDHHDVAKRSRFVSSVTRDRYMPPWIADPDYRHFANERLLDSSEIALLAAWHDQGAPEGDGVAPAPPVFREGLSPREPDLRIEMPTEFVIRGDNEEYFITFLVFIDLDGPRDLSGLEFIPGNRRMVHHANFGLYAVGDDVQTEGFNGPFVFNEADHDQQLAARYAQFVDQALYVDGWVPGKSPTHLKNRMGARLPSRFVLACQLHYAPTPVEERDRSTVDLFFHDEPIVTEIFAFAIGPNKGGVTVPDFDLIEPNTKPSFEVTFDVDKSIAVLAIAPHMHLLGKTFTAYAMTPDGKEIPLISIPEWDFSWQENYAFDRPLAIPAGSRIRLDASFDNTSSNPSNPFDPPRPIVCEGDKMQTDNEMLVMTLVYYPLPF